MPKSNSFQYLSALFVYSIYNKKPIGLLILKNDKLTDKLLTLLYNEFEELIISTIDSKDILQKDDILDNNQLQQFKFVDNIKWI